jgi:hypothetical protein
LFTVYDYVVIAGRARPSACRMMIAWREEFGPHVLRRKVVVPLRQPRSDRTQRLPYRSIPL